MHGLYSPRDLANLREEVRAWLERALVDEGGPNEITVRRRALLEYRARVHRRIVQLDAALEVRGLFDKRGKLRVAWLQQLGALISTAKAIDSMLGLTRRLKPTNTLDTYLAHAARPTGDTPP